MTLLGRIAVAALWAVLLAASVVVLAPGSAPGQWLGTRIPAAQALAFPGVFGASAVVLGLAALLLSAARARRVSARVSAVVAGPAVTLMLLGVLLTAFPVGPPWSVGPAGAVGNTGPMLRVTVFNSLDTLTAADVDRLVTHLDPDVLVLPEASPDRVRRAVAGTGFAGGVHSATEAGFSAGRPAGVAPTTIAVHARLGAVAPGDPVPTTFGAVRLDPASPASEDPGPHGVLPAILGVHTAPPVPRLMDAWRADLERLAVADADAVADGGPLILAGDLNATLRHGPLAARTRLVDTAAQCPGSPEGTWPAERPAWLRTPIDHVLVTPDVEVVDCATLRVGASDHLAYAATLRLVGDPVGRGGGVG